MGLFVGVSLPFGCGIFCEQGLAVFLVTDNRFAESPLKAKKNFPCSSVCGK